MVWTVIEMTRRKFLLSITLMGALSWIGGSSGLARLRGSQKCGTTVAEIKPCLLGLFEDLDSPRILGKRYLDLYPHEKPRVQLLATRIQSSQPWTTSTLKKSLARERELDFQNGEVVIVDGWLLSRTELGVCALTVLL
jgi:hypothetical protein